LYSLERPAPVSAPPVPVGEPSPAVEEEPSVSGVPPQLLPELHQLWAAGRHHDASPSSEIPTVAPPSTRVPVHRASAPAAPPSPTVPGPATPSPVRPARPRFTPPRVQMPQRSFRELLAMLMEEPYIFWGEFAAGLLIVGFATGLAINVR